MTQHNRFSRQLSARTLGLLALTGLGCGEGGECSNPTAPCAKVVALVLSSSSLTLEPQDIMSVTATPQDNDGRARERQVIWSTTNPSVATVSSSGLTGATVTGVSPGTATLTASAEGLTAQLSVTVRQVVAVVAVSPSTASVQVGRVTQLNTTVSDKRNVTVPGAAVTWSTSAPAIATVSASGVVTGVGVGSATITATSAGKSGSATVIVTSATTGLIAHYPFEGSFADLAGTNTLTPLGAVGFGIGIAGQALQLSGSGGLAYGPANDQLDNHAQGSFAAWIRPISAGAHALIMGYSTDQSVNSFLVLALDLGRLYVSHKNGPVGLTPTVIASSSVPAAVWTHVAAVADGVNRVRLFINGAAVQTTFLPYGTSATGAEWAKAVNEVNTHSHRIVIGALRRAGSLAGEAHFLGHIDQVRVFNRPLSAAEVLALYQQQQ